MNSGGKKAPKATTEPETTTTEPEAPKANTTGTVEYEIKRDTALKGKKVIINGRTKYSETQLELVKKECAQEPTCKGFVDAPESVRSSKRKFVTRDSKKELPSEGRISYIKKGGSLKTKKRNSYINMSLLNSPNLSKDLSVKKIYKEKY